MEFPGKFGILAAIRKTIIQEKRKPLNSESATSKTYIYKNAKNFSRNFPVNSGRPVILNVRKPLNSESGTFFTPETFTKGQKNQKFKFAEFSRESVFRGFPQNYKNFPISEVAMQNFSKFHKFWELTVSNRMEIDRMHSGTDACHLLVLKIIQTLTINVFHNRYSKS